MPTGLKAAFPGKDIFMTECEGGDSSTITGVTQNWGRNSIDWNIALDENHGPHLGGCGSCTGTTTQTFIVVYGTHSFGATLPAGGTVTYQWAQIH